MEMGHSTEVQLSFVTAQQQVRNSLLLKNICRSFKCRAHVQYSIVFYYFCTAAILVKCSSIRVHQLKRHFTYALTVYIAFKVRKLDL